jgi:hypothetical protein
MFRRLDANVIQHATSCAANFSRSLSPRTGNALTPTIIEGDLLAQDVDVIVEPEHHSVVAVVIAGRFRQQSSVGRDMGRSKSWPNWARFHGGSGGDFGGAIAVQGLHSCLWNQQVAAGIGAVDLSLDSKSIEIGRSKGISVDRVPLDWSWHLRRESESVAGNHAESDFGGLIIRMKS